MNKKILIFLLILIICLPCVSFGAVANMVEIPLKKKANDAVDFIVNKTTYQDWQATSICGNYLVICNLNSEDGKVIIYVYDKEKTPSNYTKDIQTVKSVDLNDGETAVTYKYYSYEEIEDEALSQVMERKLRTKITGFIHHANSVELDSNRNILIISARTHLPIFFNFDMDTGFIEQIDSPFKRKCKYVNGDTTSYTCATSIAYDEVEDKFYILYGKCQVVYVATAEEFYSNTLLSHLQSYTIYPGSGLKQQCKFYDGYFIYGYDHKIMFYDLRNHAYGTKATAKVSYIDTTEAELEAFSFDGDDLYVSFRDQEADYGGYSIRKTNVNKSLLVRHLIRFDGNEGTDGGTYNMIGMAKISSYTGGALPTSQRPGYKFLGWYTEEEGGTKITADTLVEGETTYYAHWRLESEVPFEEEDIAVILDVNGGQDIENDYFEVKKNTTYQNLKVNLPTPEAEDICDTFDGWYTEPEGGTKITDSYTFTEDIILYAHYATSHHTSLVNALEPTCEEPGYVSHYRCWVCEKRFIDSAGTVEVTLEEGMVDENDNQIFIVAPLGHTLVKRDRVDASRTSTGTEEYYECSRCNKKFFDSDALLVVENDNDLIIPMIESAPLKTDEPYDIILFWGQSNMVGYCGKNASERKKDTRYDYLDAEDVASYSKKTGIDEVLLSNSPKTNFVKIPQIPQSAYQYNYLENAFEELDESTKYIGEQLIYNTTNNTLRFAESGENASLEKSFGTNIVQNFCKTYYEKTGRNIIAVHCGNGGEAIRHFLPTTDTDYVDPSNKHIFESMKEKYNSAVELVESQNGIVGAKMYVCFQGESNASAGTETADYKSYFLKVHNYLKDELGISKGIIIETSHGYGIEGMNEKVQKIHKAQVQLAKNNSDILLGSSYSYDRYIPDETTYNGSYMPSSLYINASSGTKYKYENAIKKARYSIVMTEPYTHFTSPALSQIGKETALILGEEIVHTDHTLEMTEGVQPTCETSGIADYWTCTRCGKMFADISGDTEIEEPQVLPALGHDYGEWEEVTPATCTESGEERRICSRNSSHIETREIAPTGHVSGDVVIENAVSATCTERGHCDEVIYCTECGAELSRIQLEAEALGHDYGEWEEVTPATCTELGEERRVCSRDSSHIQTRETQPIGHVSGDVVIENEIPATCTEAGSYDEVVYCTKCEIELSRKNVVTEALGHNYGEWEEVTPATCTESGEERRVCSRNSSHIETREIAPLGHTLVKKNKVSAKCETAGRKAYWICSVCSKMFSDSNGVTEIEAPEVIPALGHNYGEWEEVTPATCTESGEERRVCSRNSAHTETREIPPTGHVSGDVVVENEIPATYTEAGSYDEVIYCTKCGVELSRKHKTIDALEIMKGDLDNDKHITIRDVRLLLQEYINAGNSKMWSEIDLAIKDMNDDQKVDIIDVRILLQLYINS